MSKRSMQATNTSSQSSETASGLTGRTTPQDLYVRAALDAREELGLPRHVMDRVALDRVKELLEPPAEDSSGKSGPTAA